MQTTVTRKRNETANSDSYDADLTATRTSSFTYYTSGDKKGLLETEVREPDNTALKHTTAYDYDDFGNRVKAAVTAGGETRCGTNTVEYDTYGRFVVLEKDCLGRPARRMRTYNAHGLPVQSERVVAVDGRNRIAATVDTTYEYTPGGRLCQYRAY